MTFFRILLVIDLIAGAVLLYFFLAAVADGSVFYDPGVWLGMLTVVGGTIAGALLLRRNGYKLLSTLLLMPVAWPAFGYGLFLLIVIIAQPRWN
jgi:hypothetical protein